MNNPAVAARNEVTKQFHVKREHHAEFIVIEVNVPVMTISKVA